jgi:hypothetical protein
MNQRLTIHIKNFLAVTALVLSLATLQRPLWRPDPIPQLTAKAGCTVIVPYKGQIERALIFHKRNATLSGAGPGELAVHGHAPGKMSLLIRFKGGESKVYDLIVVLG